MRKRTKIVYFAIAASFPLMLSFQNCAKNAGQMQDAATSAEGSGAKSVAAPVNSDLLPYNKEISFDESNNPIAGSGDSSSKSSGEVRIQIEDPALEHQRDLDMAVEKCEEAAQLPVTVPDVADTSEINVTGLRGVKVLSRADFDNRTDIKSITNSYGTLILCGLDVDEIYRTGGKIIAVGTVINKITSHFGNLDLLNSSAVIDASNIKLYRSLVVKSQPDISVAQ